MIGDDLISDVGGAQSVGITGVQVKTGKYRFVRETEIVSLSNYQQNIDIRIAKHRFKTVLSVYICKVDQTGLH